MQLKLLIAIIMENIIYLVEGVWQALCDLIFYDVGASTCQAWVGAAIGVASSLLNAGLGAASAAKQRREEQREYERQKAENRNWYNRRYNEDATQRADAQRALTRVNAEYKKRTQAAAGKKAIVGGTDASQAAVQQANSEAMGNALADITARADAKKDATEQSYRQREHQLDAQNAASIANAEAAKRTAIAQAATGAINAAASMDTAGEGKSTVTNSGGNTAVAKTPAMPKVNTKGLDDIGKQIARSYKSGEDPWKLNEKRLINSWGGAS